MLLVRSEAEEKIEFVTNLLKPATIEDRFAMINIQIQHWATNIINDELSIGG